MRRALTAVGLAAGLVLALAGGARAEFVAHAKDFRCLKEGATVPGKKLVIFHRNPKKLAKAVQIAQLDLRHKRYPVGTIIQIFPFEAMVKRGGGFNPDGRGWEFFNLDVTADSTRITGRTGTDGKGLKNFFGKCEDFRCHTAQLVKPFDSVCEGHLPWFQLDEALVEALRQDPRCP
jgi:hypothetical protein